MSQLGQARPAIHNDLSSKFGGLLPRIETPPPTAPPVTTEDLVDESAIEDVVDDSATEDLVDDVDLTPTKTPTRTNTAKKAPRSRRRPVTPDLPDAGAVEVPEALEAPLENSPKGGDGKATEPVQISVPASLEERLTTFKAKTGLSHPNILFDALEATMDQLPALVKAKTVQLGASSTVSLFVRPQSAMKLAPVKEERKTFLIRITKQNKAILDQLVRDTDAPNRNVLIVAAYDAYLPTDRKADGS